MKSQRRSVLRGFVATTLSASLLAIGLGAAQPALAQTTLKLSHQFPASTTPDGDFRDRLAKQFAADAKPKSTAEIGSMPYMAPEVKSQQPYTYTVPPRVSTVPRLAPSQHCL